MLFWWRREAIRRLRKFISSLFGGEVSSSPQPCPRINKAVTESPSFSTTSPPSCVGYEMLDEALSCAVCLDDFRKVPKILPTCGHSFCLPCIEHWYEFSGGSATGILRCPVCKCKTNLRILQGGSRCLKKHSSFFGHSRGDSSEKQRLPPPPLPSTLRKLLSDSPTVAAVLKIRKRLAKIDGPETVANVEPLISGLRTLLTCRACNFRLEEPRMLPACRHSFCTGCLQKIYKPSNTGLADVATIVCPACSTLYRFNYHPSTKSPPQTTTKSMNTDDKQLITCQKLAPPKEKLATYLPFDYVLSCLLDAIPEKL